MRDFPLILTQTIAQGYNIGLLAIEWDLHEIQILLGALHRV